MVTSSAIALIAINDRVGRCTRLATTILFIIFEAWVPHPSRAFRERVGILTFRLRSHRVLQLSHSTRAHEYRVLGTGYRVLDLLLLQRHRQARLRAVQMHHHRSRRLLQHELIIRQRLVDVHLQHVQRNVIFLLRPEDLNP
jgi:hypothetical protein